jgi:hypothetical protein
MASGTKINGFLLSRTPFIGTKITKGEKLKISKQLF